MHISSLRIKNYKSFLDSGELRFGTGMNIIVGPNNAGKTSLLEALALTLPGGRHRSIKALPRREAEYSGGPSGHATITVSQAELTERLQAISRPLTLYKPAHGNLNQALKAFNNARTNSIDVFVTFDSRSKSVNSALYEGAKTKEGKQEIVHIHRGEDGTYELEKGAYFGATSDFAEDVVSPLIDSIYRFYAERLNISRCKVGNNPKLKPDASNLAEVLQVLSTTNPFRFERFNQLVSHIFPEVHWVSASLISETVVEVKVWLVDKATERDDLALSLSECGTGISQALSILYVILTANRPRVFIIDEPQSFLHPRAAKKLIEILNSHSQHQYFISTHSPELLSVAKPSTITALRYEEGETAARTINLDQTDELRNVLDEVGVRFSDVFFADSILWVEGRTEEKAFPSILEKFALGTLVSNVTMLPLVNTGDLKSKKYAKKHARLVMDIYHKLSGAHALVPPVTGIILDREDTSEQEMKELMRLSGGMLRFLPRKLFENYLLDAEAIAAVANQQAGFRSVPISELEIRDWLNDRKRNKDFIENHEDFNESEWLVNVDGAKLLENLFSFFSDARVSYLKTTHSVELTKYLLEKKPALLSDLGNFLKSVLNNTNSNSSPSQ